MMTAKVTVPVWLAKRHGIPVVSQVVIKRQSAKAILVSGSGAVDGAVFCLRCGLELTNPISQQVGVGPICCGHWGIEWDADTSPEAIAALKERIRIHTTFEEIWLPKSRVTIEHAVGSIDDAPEKKENRYAILLLDQWLALKLPFASKNHIKAIPGRRWDPDNKVWMVPRTPHNAIQTLQIANDFDAVIEDEDFLSYHAESVKTISAATIAKESDELPDVPVSKTSAWMHQRQAFWFARQQEATLLAMDMGTGKSKVAIDLMVEKGCDKVLIVCPKSVFIEWPKQFDQHAGKGYEVVVLDTSHGTVADRAHVAAAALDEASGPVALIINYEAVWRQPFANWAKTVGFDMIVLDEIHRIKSARGKASTYLYGLGQDIENKLGLTGTPMPHSPMDIFAQMKFLDQSLFGTSYFRFREKYAIMGGFEGKQIVGFRNQDELHEVMYRKTFRVTKDILDLPEVVDIERNVKLEGSKNLYDSIKEHYEKMRKSGVLRKKPGKILTTLLRLQEATGGFQRDPYMEVGTEKRDALQDIFDDLPPDEPVVVFCRFRPDLDIVAEVAAGCGRTCKELSGKQNDLASWQGGNGTVLAVQIQAGGVGVDLTRAHYAVYYSLGFSLGDYEQSRARIHRPGQTETTYYYHLIAQDSIDEKVYGALAAKKDVVEAILEEG